MNAFQWQVVKTEVAETHPWPVNALMVGWVLFVIVLLVKMGAIWNMVIVVNQMSAAVNLDGVVLTVTFVSNILVVLKVELVLRLGIVFVKTTLKAIIAWSKTCPESMIVSNIHL